MGIQRRDKRKHRKVYEFIYGAIARGEYKPGDRIPTDFKLMQDFGVSRPTIARAMRELEIGGFLERCPGLGTFVRTAEVPLSMPLGLLIPRLDRKGIFGPICDEIARVAQNQSFHLHWSTVAQEHCEEAMQQFCRQCIQQKIAGVFFVPVELEPEIEKVNRRMVETLDRAGIAVVLLDRDVETFPNRSSFDLVGVDNFRIGWMQTGHLLELGSRHIEYL